MTIPPEQTEDGKTERNDRLIAVAAHSETHRDVRTLDQLGDAVLDQIEHFFASYNQVMGKEFRPVGRFGPERAEALIEEGRVPYRRGPKKGGKKAGAKR